MKAMTPADKPRKKQVFRGLKVSVNRKQVPVIFGFHTMVITEGQETALVAPTMRQLETAYDRFTGTMGEFDREQASELILIDRIRFDRTRWNRRRKTPTPDLRE